MYGAHWTGAKVLAELVEVFRRFDGIGIEARSTDRQLELLDLSRKPIAGMALLHATEAAEEHRLHLLTRARGLAKVGASIAETCRSRGWSESTNRDRAESGAERTAQWLNSRHGRLYLDTYGVPAAPSAHGSDREALGRAV